MGKFPICSQSDKEGGALLLSKLVSSACENTVISPKIADTTCELPKDLLQSTSELGPFSLTGKEGDPKVYRIKNFLGYSVPASGKPMLLPIVHDDEQADMVIIHDEDNGFHSDEAILAFSIKIFKWSSYCDL